MKLPPANVVYRRVFVGREPELRQLQQAFDAALSGRGALAMVLGEPGIGKTALCEQLASYVAAAGGQTLVGHCYEEGSLTLPYLPFVEALRSHVIACEPNQLRHELGNGAADVARIVSEVQEQLDVELRATGDPQDDRWRLYQAVTRFVHNVSAAVPLLIVLEDLHWADRGTLDFLIHLARNLEGARLLLVGTYRDVEVDRSHQLSWALAELRRAGTFDRLPLRGLTADEVQRMIHALQEKEIRDSFAAAVHQQTEGNPLFVQEVVRYLVEAGLITQQSERLEGSRRLIGDSPDIGIPEGLRDVVGRRLSRLSLECNRMLAAGAIIGRDFGLETLRQVAGAEEEPLVAALEEPVRVGVLEEHARPGQIRYRFTHAFFRQTLYEEMLAPRRLRLHQQVARALEEEYRNRLDEHVVELVEHYAQSTEQDDLAKAVAYCQMAGDRALAVYAYGEAVHLLEQAVAVQELRDPNDLAEQCDLLLALGAVLPAVGEALRAAREVAPAAFRLAEALDDNERATRVCLMAMDSLSDYIPGGLIDTPEGREWVERAYRHAAAETGERLQVDRRMSSLHKQVGRLREGRALALRALELAERLGDSEATLAAGISTMLQDWLPEDQADRRRIADDLTQRSLAGASGRNQEGLCSGPATPTSVGVIALGRTSSGASKLSWHRVPAIRYGPCGLSRMKSPLLPRTGVWRRPLN